MKRLKCLLGLLLVMGVVGCGKPTGGPPLGMDATTRHAKPLPATPVAALENLEASIERNEQGEVIDVSLTRTRITDAEMVHLKGMTNLKRLYIASTKVTDAGLVYLKGLTNLQYLNLNGSQVTDAGLVHLKKLTKLEELYLSRSKVTTTGVADLKKALPNCKIRK